MDPNVDGLTALSPVKRRSGPRNRRTEDGLRIATGKWFRTEILCPGHGTNAVSGGKNTGPVGQIRDLRLTQPR
jgi:hypothetical protein